MQRSDIFKIYILQHYILSRFCKALFLFRISYHFRGPKNGSQIFLLFCEVLFFDSNKIYLCFDFYIHMCLGADTPPPTVMSLDTIYPHSMRKNCLAIKIQWIQLLKKSTRVSFLRSFWKNFGFLDP